MKGISITLAIYVTENWAEDCTGWWVNGLIRLGFHRKKDYSRSPCFVYVFDWPRRSQVTSGLNGASH